VRKTVDVFPAIVVVAPSGAVSKLEALAVEGKLPDGAKKLDRTRVVIINNVIMIAVDSPFGPKLMFREELAKSILDGSTYKAQTSSGKTVAFKKDNNCGCGSRLRSWMPHKGILTSEADPTL
jgi:hypothetical protein